MPQYLTAFDMIDNYSALTIAKYIGSPNKAIRNLFGVLAGHPPKLCYG